MKTTIYDLLGMIKDNKAPKKIWYKGFTFEYVEDEKDYSNKEINEWLFDSCVITSILNDFVEILETTITITPKEDFFNNLEKTLNQGKKIEKIKFDMSINFIDQFTDKINEIIDKVNKND